MSHGHAGAAKRRREADRREWAEQQRRRREQRRIEHRVARAVLGTPEPGIPRRPEQRDDLIVYGAGTVALLTCLEGEWICPVLVADLSIKTARAPSGLPDGVIGG